MSFDFSDPEIRTMVQAGHLPEDIWLHNLGDPPEAARLMAIRCVKCRCDWPCPTIRELRAWKKKRDDEQEQELEEIYKRGFRKGK